MATLDPPLDVLRRQIVAASSVTLGEIGWIGDPDHQSRTSAHNPEYPAPAGNPPGEVDAIDPPHAPDRGADMGVLTEALRLSRDPRIKLVIFNRRIFSSYDHADGDPFTWRPYSGENPHTGHAHIERTDTRRDDLRPWQIGIDDMTMTAAQGYVQHFNNYLVAGMVAMNDVINVPQYKAFDGQVWAAKAIPNVQAVTIKAIRVPDIDEAQLAQELAADLAPLLADILEPTSAGLTQAQAQAVIDGALNRARIVVATPSA